jgi:hypothetical protein
MKKAILFSLPAGTNQRSTKLNSIRQSQTTLNGANLQLTSVLSKPSFNLSLLCGNNEILSNYRHFFAISTIICLILRLIVEKNQLVNYE